VRPFPGRTYTLFLVREYLRALIVCILFIMSLSYIVRALQKVDSKKGYTALQTIVLYVYDAPEILLREALLPSCMFASVFTMSSLTKNREVLALRSCAVSVYRIISPLIIIGCAVAAFSFFAEDTLLIGSYTAKDDYFARIKGEGKKKYMLDRKNVVVFGENNTIFKIDAYLNDAKEMRGVVIIRKNEEGSVRGLARAEKAVWDGKRWVLERGINYTFDAKGALAERRGFSRMATDLREDPKYFGRDTRKVDEMRLREGREYIAMTRKMGLNYKGMLARYHKRMAQSATLLFISVIGLALGSMAFKNAFVVSFSITLGFVLFFFFLNEIGYTFGASGVVPPALGGWIGNIVFFLVSVYLLSRLRV
jgi:lipopolysaccharide export system permease protein